MTDASGDCCGEADMGWLLAAKLEAEMKPTMSTIPSCLIGDSLDLADCIKAQLRPPFLVTGALRFRSSTTEGGEATHAHACPLRPQKRRSAIKMRTCR